MAITPEQREQLRLQAEIDKQKVEARAEDAAKHEKARYREVMTNAAAQGSRRELALKLLGATDMLPGEIIATLEKAPLPVAEAPLPTQAPEGLSPEIAQRAAVLGLTPSQIQWEIDYERGAAAARYLLGK